jgi:hypothetical protein
MDQIIGYLTTLPVPGLRNVDDGMMCAEQLVQWNVILEKLIVIYHVSTNTHVTPLISSLQIFQLKLRTHFSPDPCLHYVPRIYRST